MTARSKSAVQPPVGMHAIAAILSKHTSPSLVIFLFEHFHGAAVVPRRSQDVPHTETEVDSAAGSVAEPSGNSAGSWLVHRSTANFKTARQSESLQQPESYVKSPSLLSVSYHANPASVLRTRHGSRHQ